MSGAGEQSGGSRARPVVVGVDGSDPSVEAARWACAQARLTGARVEMIAAWQSPGTWGMAWGTSVPIPVDYDPAADAATMLAELVATLVGEGHSVPIDTRAVEGHPAQVLVEASRHADLLVLASRGHGEFTGMLLGSVSQYCAAHAACPVVIVRGAGKDAPAG
jgi:nucleotide-binding universal stress UspA family protein